jgi:hypothetical protein
MTRRWYERLPRAALGARIQELSPEAVILKGVSFCLPGPWVTVGLMVARQARASISGRSLRVASTSFLKLHESNFLLYATGFSIMRSLVKRLGMGLPNNLLPEFPAKMQNYYLKFCTVVQL